MMLTLLDRHIGRRIFASTLLVLGVLLALFVFFTLVDALGDFGKGGFGLYELVRYVILSQPRKIYELFPIAVLIGVIMGLSTLALNSELIAMRAAGVSAARIVGAAMKIGLAFIAAGVVLGEFAMPPAENLAQQGRARALGVDMQQKDSGLWLRDGESFVNVGEVLPDLSLLRINIYSFEGARLRAQTAAQRAWHDGERWRLEGVTESRIGDDSVRLRRAGTSDWASVLTPEVVGVFAVKPEGLSAWRLQRYIQHLQQNNQDARRYRLAFWQKLLMPLAAAVMVLLAAPFVFQPFRGGGMGQRVFFGIMLGLAFVMLSRGFGYFGLLYGLPPLVGAAVPVALFLFLALFLLRRAM